ncbi:MAG: NAD-dependent epimerase/dehydratase family protein, partial [Deltaproteobacteria bacterium]|nr:NAD-dependent epimerase/dehydratase family protein [Deltaproteobacteria bacterium]
LAAEHLIFAMIQERALPGVVIRPFNVFGPGQVGEGAVQRFVHRALRGAPLTVSGDGSQIRAWCYVDDFIDGLLRTLSHPGAVGQTFHIGNPQTAVTVYHLAALIVQLTGSASEIRCVPRERVDVELRIPDIEAARSILGFVPSVSLEQGLAQTIAWYRQHASLTNGQMFDGLPDTVSGLGSGLNEEGANNYGPH